VIRFVGANLFGWPAHEKPSLGISNITSDDAVAQGVWLKYLGALGTVWRGSDDGFRPKKSSAKRDEWLDSRCPNPLTSVGARLPAIGFSRHGEALNGPANRGQARSYSQCAYQAGNKKPDDPAQVAGLSGDALRSVSSAKGESMNARMITRRD